ncbi:MAG: hypothetical protein SGCHY_004898 [Lobulomycetales sp.]
MLDDDDAQGREEQVGRVKVVTAVESDEQQSADEQPDETAEDVSEYLKTLAPGLSLSLTDRMATRCLLDEEHLDLTHSRLSKLPFDILSTFSSLQTLCLRQNLLSDATFAGPDLGRELPKTLMELDLYDNRLSHVPAMISKQTGLTKLDLSFNKIKTIDPEIIGALCNLKELYLVANKVSIIQGLDTLVNLQCLELGANRIREIHGLDALQNLESLWLGKNKITSLQNLPLPNLKILSIQSNRITSLDPDALAGMPNLEELYISHNGLLKIEGLDRVPRLRIVDVGNNRLETLEGLQGNVENLEEFWASYNQFSSFQDVENQLSEKKGLTTVYFEGCPLQTENRPTYRNKLKLALPSLKQIDATYCQ